MVEAWSAQFVAEYSRLNPLSATLIGDNRYDDQWGRLDLVGVEQQVEFLERQLAGLRRLAVKPSSLRGRACYHVITTELERYRREEHFYDLNSISSTFQGLLSAYDNTLPRHQPARLARLPVALEQYISLLRAGLLRGKVVARRQVEAVIAQTRERSELPLQPLADFLQHEYLPRASAEDGIGADRYAYYVQLYAGGEVDLLELYDWGYQEIDRLRRQMAKLRPRLQQQGAPVVQSETEFFTLINQYQQQAFDFLRPYFEFPAVLGLPLLKSDPLETAASYLPPAGDFSRLGTITYPQRYPRSTLTDMSTAFHEGFPGHHLQLTVKVANRRRLTEVQRLLYHLPVYDEGWGLYAEQLMVDLGWYERQPACHLYGKYQDEILRACRLVVDLGIHLGLTNRYTGRKWDYDQMVSLLVEVGERTPDYARKQATRYCGWPFQACCYKLGARRILHYRDRWLGQGYSLKDFHTAFLELGCADLDYMDRFFTSN